MAAGAYLAACPVVTPRHAALGLLLAGLAHAGAAAGGRFAPEALNFVADLLADAAQGALVILVHWSAWQGPNPFAGVVPSV
jgi:hypothetical protein